MNHAERASLRAVSAYIHAAASALRFVQFYGAAVYNERSILTDVSSAAIVGSVAFNRSAAVERKGTCMYIDSAIAGAAACIAYYFAAGHLTR